ncbi:MULTISPECIES: radical SAM protein [unclassified Streptomyces]|uniref:radical SAM protein n=1 Tax=unclassified Streptomyces TaxID=2593676 RepID=UPI000DAB5546|nr:MULTISPECIES: radical SAM protein [unclassified Streptomyces]PZT72568.1 radical SAM protein [Streptomyces sp. AC1-42T]PZT81114.1 radical SAM protein [Streptomyces sp. AC1-42W]
MAHALIASPFLDGHLLLKPGARAGARIPADHYEQLRDAAVADQVVPGWLSDTAWASWGVDVAGLPAQGTVLVREPSPYGYCRASWEINLGCNFGCKHCYLGERPFSGLPWEDKVRLLDIMREAGVLWLQITGGEPTMDPHFQDAYRYAWLSGMMLTVSTNGSLLWRPDLLDLFRDCPPYRLVVSMYGASETSFDALTQRRGAWKAFRRGMDAAREAGLPLRINVVVTEDNASEADAMTALASEWDVENHAYTNMTPTIYGGGEPLLAQSAEHLRRRKPFAGCNAGHTFFHADPHAKVSICKVGRDDRIDLMAEGIEGLRRLGAIADRLMLRTGGCEGCALSGTCRVCRPLAKHYQKAKAPLHSYCQHGEKEKVTS